jgi:hypothetical protein
VAASSIRGKERAMSTQQLAMPGVVVQRTGRGIVLVSIVAALFAGVLIGRETAPTPSQVTHPAALLSTIGNPSVGDARRAEMFGAMNGLTPPASIQPATRLDPRDVGSESSERLTEMFGAMNRLRQRSY